jgi:hypothetical protein
MYEFSYDFSYEFSYDFSYEFSYDFRDSGIFPFLICVSSTEDTFPDDCRRGVAERVS